MVPGAAIEEAEIAHGERRGGIALVADFDEQQHPFAGAGWKRVAGQAFRALRSETVRRSGPVTSSCAGVESAATAAGWVTAAASGVDGDAASALSAGAVGPTAVGSGNGRRGRARGVRRRLAVGAGVGMATAVGGGDAAGDWGLSRGLRGRCGR